MSEPRRFTYIATRAHPDAGVLLKVGTSIDPVRRCCELGATLHRPLLPARCEDEIHAFLHGKRVWSRRWAGYVFQPHPVFPAPTEWFYIDPALGEWLRVYIRFIRATDFLLQ